MLSIPRWLLLEIQYIGFIIDMTSRAGSPGRGNPRIKFPGDLAPIH